MWFFFIYLKLVSTRQNLDPHSVPAGGGNAPLFVFSLRNNVEEDEEPEVLVSKC